MLLPVAVVVDDSVNHVARPIDIGLVAHHRDVVLAVLVALLVYGGVAAERERREEGIYVRFWPFCLQNSRREVPNVLAIGW